MDLMIVILCESDDAAYENYELFLMFLEEEDPWSIIYQNPYGRIVKTDIDLDYIFIYHRFEYLFSKEECDFVWDEEFFCILETIYNERRM